MANDHERRIERLENIVAQLVEASTHVLEVLLPVVKATGTNADKEVVDALAKLQRVSQQVEKERCSRGR